MSLPLLFTEPGSFRDKTFDDVIETVSAMNAVVDRLYQAAKKLTWEHRTILAAVNFIQLNTWFLP